jgi:3-isopropylmalate/(R)-2-methylmalate dehydratase small subunit
LLPVVLPESVITELSRRALSAQGGYELTVDLRAQRVQDPLGFAAPFHLDPYRREMLLQGLDEIGRTLQLEPAIAAFEQRRAADQPVPVW